MIKQTNFILATLRGSLLLCCLTLSMQGFAITVDVSVDRNPVNVNESFKLVFSASESLDEDPDFSPLNKQFQVLKQQKSSQSSWVNGTSTKRISWVLDVMAKQPGVLQVPVIAFGDDSSATLQINVVAGKTSDKLTVNDDLYLEIETAPDQVYVQSQLLYTIRLFQRVQITQASLSEPTPTNAIVEKIGEDSQYATKINGVSYSVFERKYAIFPQQSGELNIPPIELTAQVVSTNRASRYGGIFNPQHTRTKRVQSKAVTMNVLPVSNAFTGQHWLAAESVQMQQTWSSDDLIVVVGEPLTRTVSMIANGVTASQLPELLPDNTLPDLKMYPDKAVLKNQTSATGIISLREQKTAIIPAQAGDYRLPAIEVPWFNTRTQNIEMAVIPAVTIIAIAKQGVTNTLTNNSGQSLKSVETDAKSPAVDDNNIWKWLSITMVVVWLFTLAWLTRKHFINKNDSQPGKENEQAPIKKVIKNLQKACDENDAKNAKKALLQWGHLQYKIHDLESISGFCNESLQAEIKRLNQSLYAKDKANWDGSVLAKLVIEHTEKLGEATCQTDELEPLHRL